MFSYDPFFRTLDRKKIKVSELIDQHGIPSGTITRINHGKSITVYSLDKLCQALNCRIGHIVEYRKDPE